MARHLTKAERDTIAQLHAREFSQKQIAAALGRDESTISRELARNRVSGEYFAAQAQDLAQRRRRERPLCRKLDDPELNATVRRGLAQEWSPEKIEGAQKRAHPDDPTRHVSARTIYTWIEQDEDRDHWKAGLRRPGKRPRRHSITFDNGTEFARCQRLEKHLHLQPYFADPGCPYQRGTNENTNGLIRPYSPKGTDFRTISHDEVRRVENLLNNRSFL